MCTLADVFDGWSLLERELPQNYRELAASMKLIVPHPPHLGAKIDDASCLLRLLLAHASGLSLEATTARACSAGLPDISAVALHKWERKATPWLCTLLGEMLAADGAAADFEGDTIGGYRLVVVDATTLQRPGAMGTTARIHYAMRLPGLELVHCEETDVSGGETWRRFQAQPGELWVGDRAYGTPPGVASVHDQGGSVLVRINKTNLPVFTAGGQRIDIDAALRKATRRAKPVERVAYVYGPQGQRIAGRLCVLWLPEEQAKSARERARREKKDNGEPVTQDALRTAEYVIIFTTALAERIPLALVYRIYQARWQIELQVKRSKSVGHVDRLPNFRDDTIATWLYANLLIQQLARRLADSDTKSAIPPCRPDRTGAYAPQTRIAAARAA